MAQNVPTEHKFPTALDSFFLRVDFVDGSKKDYEAYKERDTVRRLWLLSDTVVYNMMEFDNIETMLMFLMHVEGQRAKSYTIIPMLPPDMDKYLINRHPAKQQ
jgi:hypothetical protein